MVNLNRVIIAGNLTRTPEIKFVGNDKRVCDLSMAINEPVKGADGERSTRAVFVTCTLWGKSAEYAAEHAAKGANVVIDGALQYDQWTDGDGKKRNGLKVRVNRFQLCNVAHQGVNRGAAEDTRPDSRPDNDPPF